MIHNCAFLVIQVRYRYCSREKAQNGIDVLDVWIFFFREKLEIPVLYSDCQQNITSGRHDAGAPERDCCRVLADRKEIMMKKRRKRYLACLLGIILAAGITGCTPLQNGTKNSRHDSNNASESFWEDSGGPEGTKLEAGEGAKEAAGAKGRYIETKIDIPQDFSGEGSIRQLTDKSLVLLDVKNCMLHTSKDNGKTWDTKAVHALENMWNEEPAAEISSIALAEDGGAFISYLPKESGSGGIDTGKYLYFSVLDPEGAMQKFELNTRTAEYLNESVFTPDGRLFAMSTLQNVYEIYLDQKSCQQVFTVDSGSDAALCSNEEFLIAADGAKVYFYDLKSGKTEDEDQVLNSYIAKQREKSFGLALCAADNGKDRHTLYVAGCSGIAGHVIGGSVMEQLVDGALSGLGDPSRPPREILHHEDGSFLVLFEDGELDTYTYDKNAPAVPQQQLVIYGLYDNETVRQAVSVFRKKNPEVFVRFETGLNGENGMTQNDAVKNLNMELLAKEGPDIILLDHLPLESYEEKGILMDLGSLADDLASSGDYFEGILHGYQSADGTYALPFRYQVPLLAGESSILSEISDLKTLADAAEKLADLPSTPETVLGSYSPEETLEKLYLTSANAWTVENGEADPAILQEFLVQAKRIYQADQKNLDEEELHAHREYVEHIRNAYKNKEGEAEKVLHSICRLSNQIPGNQVLTAGYLTAMNDFATVTAVQRELGEQNISISYQLLNGQAQKLFCPTGTVGISANSRNKETAEEFIRVLLGSDVQKRDFADGFPVNADAYEAFAADPMPGKVMVMGEEDREGNAVVIGLRWPKKQELEQLKTILDSLNTPAVFDDSLKNEVVTIGAQALKGDREIEDSAEEIAQKISLHLKE